MEYQALSTIEMDVIIIINSNILFFESLFFVLLFFLDLVSVFVFLDTNDHIFEWKKKKLSFDWTLCPFFRWVLEFMMQLLSFFLLINCEKWHSKIWFCIKYYWQRKQRIWFKFMNNLMWMCHTKQCRKTWKKWIWFVLMFQLVMSKFFIFFPFFFKFSFSLCISYIRLNHRCLLLLYRMGFADVCQSNLIKFELCAVYFSISIDRWRLWSRGLSGKCEMEGIFNQMMKYFKFRAGHILKTMFCFQRNLYWYKILRLTGRPIINDRSKNFCNGHSIPTIKQQLSRRKNQGIFRENNCKP